MSVRLRVAFVAGTLGQGGAEKQLVYSVKSLKEAGFDVRVFSLTTGEWYEDAINELNAGPDWIGRYKHSVLRLYALARQVAEFRPHVLQASHFFANLYVGIVGRLSRTLSIGAIRSDLEFDVSPNGRWGPHLLRAPSALISNSHAARARAVKQGIDPAAVRVVQNVIDVAAFDEMARLGSVPFQHAGDVVVVAVGNHLPVKRFDRFLHALADARSVVPNVRGILIGDGPERNRLEHLAGQLGLLPNGVTFAGRCTDVPSLLSATDLLVSTSDHEGFPNVILEAMAARLPVVSTPVGDIECIVQDGRTGFVVQFDDLAGVTNHIVELARSPSLREELGTAGRSAVESQYDIPGLGDRLVEAYHHFSRVQERKDMLALF